MSRGAATVDVHDRRGIDTYLHRDARLVDWLQYEYVWGRTMR